MITYYLLHNLFRRMDIFHYMIFFVQNVFLLSKDDGMYAMSIVKTSFFIYRSSTVPSNGDILLYPQFTQQFGQFLDIEVQNSYK